MDTPENPDRLIVKGLGRNVEGEYQFNIVDMVMNEGSPQYLTSREGHKVYLMSGIAGAALPQAVLDFNYAVMVALMVILLERNGKTVNEEKLWDAKIGDEITFDIYDRRVEEEDESPPAEALPPASEPTVLHAKSGGASLNPTSDDQGNDPSPTGHQDSERSATSARLTSAV